ncbi:DUF2513 domain-containing protein [Agarivorans sp. 1_MG-2023]|uniref:DUF2513 domain-containing protein n=1 Tax=Agarivorans sp. 1_MG-2023 TaxID=3062634 RepID=UPI0026E41EE4|nr:DUF2513 domain-containing protein [Agarivorans sp. 1_MG-2023]MDO6766068.1 DUF2513 domain-containing protein [Agarivorans sp. 1_MG-2023]
MNIDLQYISKLLNVFIESDKAHLSIVDLNSAGIDSGDSLVCEEYIFHMQILLDNKLISDENGNANGLKTIGIGLNGNKTYRKLITNIRLTQDGHDFAKALNNREILDKLKTELKDAPFKAIFEGGQKLLQHLAKKKLDELLNP